jgi:hypothetical protein
MDGGGTIFKSFELPHNPVSNSSKEKSCEYNQPKPINRQAITENITDL